MLLSTYTANTFLHIFFFKREVGLDTAILPSSRANAELITRNDPFTAESFARGTTSSAEIPFYLGAAMC